MDWPRLSINAGDNWDLNAVVKGCCSSSSSSSLDTTIPTTTTKKSYENITYNNSTEDNHLACLASLQFEDEPEPFSFQNLLFQEEEEKKNNNSFEELQDSYKPFYSTGSSTSQANVPNSASTFPVEELINEQQQQQQQLVFDFIEPQSQDNHHHQQPENSISVHHPLQAMQPQTLTRYKKKRKTQQKKRVCHVIEENLTTDVWAWRKYGQKPIKGSPFPRNYYRCSSSKGCSARKQVEQSNSDRNIFIVSYTGEHTHPRPTHRNSLAGSSRNKYSKINKGRSTNSCSSPLSATTSQYSISHTDEEGENKDDYKETTVVVNEKSSGFVVEEEENNEPEKDLLVSELASAIDENLFTGLGELDTSFASGELLPSPKFPRTHSN